MRARALALLVVLALGSGTSCMLVQRVIEPPCPTFERAALDVPAGTRVLLFSKTHGYRHDSIPAARAAVVDAANAVGLPSFATESSAFATRGILKDLDVVVFISANGTLLSPMQEAALRAWVESGGSVILLHGAVGDFDRASPWWWTLIGARFVGHTMLPQLVDTTVRVNPGPLTARLPSAFQVIDEIYAFDDVRVARDEVVLRQGDGQPLAWLHRVGAGRVFVLALGHTPEFWSRSEVAVLLHDVLAVLAAPS